MAGLIMYPNGTPINAMSKESYLQIMFPRADGGCAGLVWHDREDQLWRAMLTNGPYYYLGSAKPVFDFVAQLAGNGFMGRDLGQPTVTLVDGRMLDCIKLFNLPTVGWLRRSQRMLEMMSENMNATIRLGVNHQSCACPGCFHETVWAEWLELYNYIDV